jgi:hypothetical protein
MEVKVPFKYGTIWLLITEWIVQRCNQSHAKKGRVNLQKANVAGAISLVTHLSVQLNV